MAFGPAIPPPTIFFPNHHVGTLDWGSRRFASRAERGDYSGASCRLSCRFSYDGF